MRRVTVLALVAGIALSAAPIPAAHAGSRAIGVGMVFQCYVISDTSPGNALELTDTLSDPRVATLGPARLVCGPAEASRFCVEGDTCTDARGKIVSGPGPSSSYNTPLAGGIAINGFLKCYALRSSQTDNPGTVVNMSDPFQEERNVPLGSAQLLCVEVGLEKVPE
jgi:hypothetical protein